VDKLLLLYTLNYNIADIDNYFLPVFLALGFFLPLGPVILQQSSCMVWSGGNALVVVNLAGEPSNATTSRTTAWPASIPRLWLAAYDPVQFIFVVAMGLQSVIAVFSQAGR
jgi:hypothetical protein